ncbi:MAG TPA: hypothetical protein VK907_08140, partial [Phnomibacter sp.]|nr:hypothetical protein [Phnomibacter sp.]
NEADGVYIYGITKGQQIVIGDTTEPVLSFPQSISRQPVPSTRFSRSSFDIDFLTIPLKFRPSRIDVPMQLEPNLSGALYLGYRNDMYTNHFRQEPKGYLRQTTHIGFSLGAFAGLGNSVINPTMTGFATDQEYNGVVLLYGIALIAGIDRITLGLTLGADELMDANKNKWIYQRKPWIGIGFGLNLN